MDMVNDGKDIHLDTPQAVKEALASGKDLYNPQTGEFWWEYNYTGSIANTYVHLDDPNLLAVIDNPDFDLYEAFVDRGISLKAEAESMRRASQALSADGSVDEREPSFIPDLS